MGSWTCKTPFGFSWIKLDKRQSMGKIRTPMFPWNLVLTLKLSVFFSFMCLGDAHNVSRVTYHAHVFTSRRIRERIRERIVQPSHWAQWRSNLNNTTPCRVQTLNLFIPDSFTPQHRHSPARICRFPDGPLSQKNNFERVTLYWLTVYDHTL